MTIIVIFNSNSTITVSTIIHMKRMVKMLFSLEKIAFTNCDLQIVTIFDIIELPRYPLRSIELMLLAKYRIMFLEHLN